MNVEKLVMQWLEQCVVGLSLCPYARAPIAAGKVRLAVCSSTAASEYVAMFLDEAAELADSNIETTLVIAPKGFEDFFYFNEIAGDAEDALVSARLDQNFQLASFHPDYLFAEDEANDLAHFTNRAPFPILQLLRVASVARAVDGGDTLLIPEHNSTRLRSMPSTRLRELFPWSVHWLEDQ